MNGKLSVNYDVRMLITSRLIEFEFSLIEVYYIGNETKFVCCDVFAMNSFK